MKRAHAINGGAQVKWAHVFPEVKAKFGVFPPYLEEGAHLGAHDFSIYLKARTMVDFKSKT